MLKHLKIEVDITIPPALEAKAEDYTGDFEMSVFELRHHLKQVGIDKDWAKIYIEIKQQTDPSKSINCSFPIQQSQLLTNYLSQKGGDFIG